MSASGVYLDAYLSPLAAWLERDDVTDLLINRPGEVWVETVEGVMTCEPAPQVSEVVLGRLARQRGRRPRSGTPRPRSPPRPSGP